MGNPLPMDEVERRYILAVIRKCKGNISRAARILNLSRRTLQNKQRKWEYYAHRKRR